MLLRIRGSDMVRVAGVDNPGLRHSKGCGVEQEFTGIWLVKRAKTSSMF